MTQGASLEHCTPSDILGCDTLKRQENEFSSYLCKQFRKHIHQFLFSERFYFCGDFSRTKDSISKLYQGKEKKRWNPHHTTLATSNAAPIATIGNFLVSLAQSRAPVKCDDDSTDCLTSLPQYSWWILSCWCGMASSSGYLEPLPAEDKLLVQQGVNNEIQE